MEKLICNDCFCGLAETKEHYIVQSQRSGVQLQVSTKRKKGIKKENMSKGEQLHVKQPVIGKLIFPGKPKGFA